MVISYFNKENNILETTFSGEVYAGQVVDYVLEIKENKSYPRKLKNLITATQSQFKLSIKDLKVFNNIKTEILENYEIVIVAIIVDNPYATAISTMFQVMSNNDRYKFSVFSSHEAALFWLDSFTVD